MPTMQAFVRRAERDDVIRFPRQGENELYSYSDSCAHRHSPALGLLDRRTESI
jgi:hypothetical protein